MLEYASRFVERKAEYVELVKEFDYPKYSHLLAAALRVTGLTGLGHPNPELVKAVDFGDYEGVLVLVVGDGYSSFPNKVWVTTVHYGSCSGCDALEAATGYARRHDFEALFTLALHMLQRMQEVAAP